MELNAAQSDRFGTGIRAGQLRHQRKRSRDQAKISYEHFIELARASARFGDHVTTENLYQHAEHYVRVMKAQSAS